MSALLRFIYICYTLIIQQSLHLSTAQAVPLNHLMSALRGDVMKKGRPEIKKTDLSSQRLQEALNYRKTSLRKLNTNPILSASERTIRRAKETGKINPDILDRLGKCLDVDPYFLGGEYDKMADLYASSPEEATEIKSQFIVADHPYVLHERRQQGAMQYIKDLMIDNEIPPSTLDEMPMERLAHFFLDMERAVSKVLWQYFDYPSRSIHNYTIPMPPEDEIVKL